MLGTMHNSPSNSYAETLTPNMVVLGVGAAGRWLGSDEDVRVEIS